MEKLYCLKVICSLDGIVQSVSFCWPNFYLLFRPRNLVLFLRSSKWNETCTRSSLITSLLSSHTLRVFIKLGHVLLLYCFVCFLCRYSSHVLLARGGVCLSSETGSQVRQQNRLDKSEWLVKSFYLAIFRSSVLTVPCWYDCVRV